MTFKRAVLGCSLAVLLGAASAGAQGERIRVATPKISTPCDEATRVAFIDVVRVKFAAVDPTPARAYTLSPALIQLRRFLEDGRRTPTLACVIDIAVSDERGVLIATVRGSTKALNASPRQALEGAADAALRKLGPVLVADGQGSQARKPIAKN
ncbi:MAG TPA: hypothetical protein VGM29_16140 [Polyangiaceae bacterium]|jgi:hypothetical protein